MLFTFFVVAVTAASSVRAHGYVQVVNAGGTDYPGWRPFEDPYASPVPQTIERKVADDGPLTFDAAELTCNKGGDQGNGASATIAAGQSVKYTMNRWPDDHHGPVSLYMANCNGDCNSFSGSGNVWFKLSSTGLIDPSSFTWASDKLIADGNSWTGTVPSNIKAGNYLMRLELLALHSAGQPQLYPSCTQLTVTGGGDGAPTDSELVSIPGVYKSGDPALFGDIWNSPQSWPQVGPDVAAFVLGGSSDPAPSPIPTSSQASTSNAPASTGVAPISTAAPTSTATPTSDPASSSDPAPTSAPEPTSTYSEAEPEGATSKTASGSGPTKSNKVCRRKVKAFVKKSSLHAKREYMRGLGKRWF